MAYSPLTLYTATSGGWPFNRSHHVEVGKGRLTMSRSVPSASSS